LNVESPAQAEAQNWFDLAIVSDPYVHEVLENLLDDWRMKKRWDDITPQLRHLHQAVLQGYLASGRPPSRAQLEAGFTGPVKPALADLVTRDMILLDEGEVVGAYPFTSRPSRHKVLIEGQEINAMCAIDALGAGAMAGCDAQVHAECAQCGEAVTIDLVGGGLSIDTVTPSTAVVWAGVKDISGCAANTQCRAIVLFCGDEHLKAWRDATQSEHGFQLTPAQAVQAGAAIFRPFLTRT
jgi:alkylmercury lyase-like protein